MRARRRGLSLIEVIVSTTLLGALGFILLFFFLSTAQPLRQARHREFALSLASYHLELARTQSAQSLPPGDYPQPKVTAADGAVFAISLKVEPVAGFTAEELRHLEVRVDWKESGRSLQVEQSRQVCDVSF